jgi:hypothetical protein
MALGFTALGLALHLSAMRTEILRRRIRTLSILEAERLDVETERLQGEAERLDAEAGRLGSGAA